MDYEQLYRQMIDTTQREVRYALHMYKEYDRCWNTSSNTSYLEARNKWLYKLTALKILYQSICFQMPTSLRYQLVNRDLLDEVLNLVGA